MLGALHVSRVGDALGLVLASAHDLFRVMVLRWPICKHVLHAEFGLEFALEIQTVCPA